MTFSSCPNCLADRCESIDRERTDHGERVSDECPDCGHTWVVVTS